MGAEPGPGHTVPVPMRRRLWYIVIPAVLLVLLVGLVLWLRRPSGPSFAEQEVLRRLAPYGVRYKLDKGRHVKRLVLEGRRVKDKALDENLAALPALRRISLHNSSITDAGLLKLGGLKRLQALGLGGTKVTDQGLSYLKQMPSLRHVYVWQSDQLTPQGIASLQQALPRVKVHILNTHRKDIQAHKKAEQKANTQK